MIHPSYSQVPTSEPGASGELSDDTESGDDILGRDGFWSSSARAAAVLTVVIFAGCVAVLALEGRESGDAQTRYSRAPSQVAGLTARSLLESQEFRDIATANILKTTDLHSKDDVELVRATVAASLRNISDRPEFSSSADVRRLNEVQLTNEQRDSVLKVVKSMGDPLAQKFGYEIAKTVAEGRSEGRDGVKRRLMQKFRSQAPDLLAIKKEIMPALPGHWHVSMDPSRMRMFRDLPDSTHVEIDMSQPKLASHQGRWLQDSDSDSDLVGTAPSRRRRRSWSQMANSLAKSASNVASSKDISLSGKTGSMLTPNKEEDMEEQSVAGLGILAGMLEQCRVALDQVDFVGNSFGEDLKIPSLAKSFVGGLSFAAELTDCVSRAGENDVKEAMCPMKYGSAFVDLISCVDNLFGFDNENLGVLDTGAGSDIGSSASAPVPAAPVAAPTGKWSWS